MRVRFKGRSSLTKHPVLTTNIQSQDIKDHLREAGDVYYAEVYGDGSGIVEFARQKDVDTAVEKLDNTKFKSHEVCMFYQCDRNTDY